MRHSAVLAALAVFVRWLPRRPRWGPARPARCSILEHISDGLVPVSQWQYKSLISKA
jgi:hypothetical protein